MVLAASGADRVSFHRIAGRSGRPSSPSTTSPCCWPATEIAATSEPRPVLATACASASHQTSGAVSLAPPSPVTMWGAWPEATIVPRLGVDEQDLGRLGRAVDSGDESWHGRVVWRTPRKRTRRLQ